MNIIATGFLKIETLQDNQIDNLANVMIRIFKLNCKELIFEDFFMTNTEGKTHQISLYAPSKVFMKEHEQQEVYETYQLELRCKGYQTQVLNEIKIFANMYSTISVHMKKKDEQNADDEASIHCFNICDFQQKIVKIENFKKKELFPKNIQVSQRIEEDGTEGSITIPFVEYVKYCACCEFYPTWPEAVLKANIILLMTMLINNCNQAKEKHTCHLISNYPPYKPYCNLYSNITKLVNEVYGLLIFQTSLSFYCQSWNPTLVLAQATPQMDAYSILKTYIKIPIMIEKVGGFQQHLCFDNLSSYLENSHEDWKLIKNWLCEIAKVYKDIPMPSYNYLDKEMQASIRLFQLQFNLTPNGIVDRSTYLKLQSTYEIVKDQTVTNLAEDIEDKQCFDTNIVHEKLYFIAKFYKNIETDTITKELKQPTSFAVRSFQELLGLQETGIVDNKTFQLIEQVYNELLEK